MKPRVFIPEPIAAVGMELLQTECDCIAPWMNQANSGGSEPHTALAEAEGVLVRLFPIRSDDIARA